MRITFGIGKQTGDTVLLGIVLLTCLFPAGTTLQAGTDSRTPIFTCSPPDPCVFEVGRPCEFPLFAEAPRGGNLRFRTNRLPDGASFDPESRIFSWTPDRGQEGYYLGFEIAATNNRGESARVIFNINVTSEHQEKSNKKTADSDGKTAGDPPGLTESGKSPRTPGDGPAETEDPAGDPVKEEELPADSAEGGTEEESPVVPTPLPIPTGTPELDPAAAGKETPRPEPSPEPSLTPETSPSPGKRDIFVTTSRDENDPETDPDNPLGEGLSLREAVGLAEPGWKIRFKLSSWDSRIILTDRLIIDQDGLVIAGEGTISIDASGTASGTAFKISGSNNSIRGLTVINCDHSAIQIVDEAIGNVIEDNIFYNFRVGIILDGDGVRETVIRNNDINVGDEADVQLIHSGENDFSTSEIDLLQENGRINFLATSAGLYLHDRPFDFDSIPDSGFSFAGHVELNTRIAAAVITGYQPYFFSPGVDPELFQPLRTLTVTTKEDQDMDPVFTGASLSLRQILLYLDPVHDRIIFDRSSWPPPKHLELKMPLEITGRQLYLFGGDGESLIIIPQPGTVPGYKPPLSIYTAGNMLENLKLRDWPGPTIFLGPGAEDTLIGFGTALTPWIRGSDISLSITDVYNNKIYDNNFAVFSTIINNRNLQIYMRFY